MSPWCCSSVSLRFVKTWARGKYASRYWGQYLARETSDNPPALNASHCQSTSTTPISLGTEHQPRVRVQRQHISSSSKKITHRTTQHMISCEAEEETEQWRQVENCSGVASGIILCVFIKLTISMPKLNHLNHIFSFSMVHVMRALTSVAQRPPFITMPMSSQDEQWALSQVGQHLKN